MKVFNFDDFTYNLPDAFCKDKESNNYKLLMVEKYIYDRINTMYQSVFDILDIDNAHGVVLDEIYGTRLNLKRGALNDIQYRLRLKAKISQSMSDGTRNGIAEALAYTLNTTSDKIKIKADENSKTVQLLDLPLAVLDEAECTTDDVLEMLDSMLPQGVHVSAANFTGTFELAEFDNTLENLDANDVYDENTGLSDLEETFGGELGLLGTI